MTVSDCMCVWLWACGGEGFQVALPPPVRRSVRRLNHNGHNPFKTVELESSEDKKDKDGTATTARIFWTFFFFFFY